MSAREVRDAGGVVGRKCQEDLLDVGIVEHTTRTSNMIHDAFHRMFMFNVIITVDELGEHGCCYFLMGTMQLQCFSGVPAIACKCLWVKPKSHEPLEDFAYPQAL